MQVRFAERLRLLDLEDFDYVLIQMAQIISDSLLGGRVIRNWVVTAVFVLGGQERFNFGLELRSKLKLRPFDRRHAAGNLETPKRL